MVLKVMPEEALVAEAMEAATPVESLDTVDGEGDGGGLGAGGEARDLDADVAGDLQRDGRW